MKKRCLWRAAIQGDFSDTNIILKKDNSLKGLIDFNISGDEVLVNDMITQGIFVCYIMDLEENLQYDDRFYLFNIFVSEYPKYRRLKNTETVVLNNIYRIVFTFLWIRVDALEKFIEHKDTVNITRLLEDTLDFIMNGTIEEMMAVNKKYTI